MNEPVRKQQSTHWYRSGGKFSFTADPRRADPGEVQRVGLHDCQQIGCTEFHANGALEYSLWLIQKYSCGNAGKS